MKESFARKIYTPLWYSAVVFIFAYYQRICEHFVLLSSSFQAQNCRQNIKHASNPKSKADSAFHNHQKKSNQSQLKLKLKYIVIRSKKFTNIFGNFFDTFPKLWWHDVTFNSVTAACDKCYWVLYQWSTDPLNPLILWSVESYTSDPCRVR